MHPSDRPRITSPYYLSEAVYHGKVAIFDTSALMFGNAILTSRSESETGQNARYMAYLQSVLRHADNVISTDELLNEATGVAREFKREGLDQESDALFRVIDILEEKKVTFSDNAKRKIAEFYDDPDLDYFAIGPVDRHVIAVSAFVATKEPSVVTLSGDLGIVNANLHLAYRERLPVINYRFNGKSGRFLIYHHTDCRACWEKGMGLPPRTEGLNT